MFDLEVVGHDEPRPAVHGHVVGEVVVQAQAVVEEATLLGQQLPRVRTARGAREPAEGPLARRADDGGNRAPDVLTLLLSLRPVELFPALAVAADLVLRGDECLGHARVALERAGAGPTRRAHA